MKMKNYLLIIVSIALVISFISCGQEKQEVKDSSTEQALNLKGMSGIVDNESAKNILQIAVGSKDHTILVAAVLAAGLEDVLANPGPLTVFAPTNAAFEKLPEGVVEFLLKPENKDSLIHIITYHAAPGTYMGKMLKNIMYMGQATGEKVVIETTEDGVTVNGANIIATIKASNGVVHVIDEVLLPPAK